jgi:hypothetical protein
VARLGLRRGQSRRDVQVARAARVHDRLTFLQNNTVGVNANFLATPVELLKRRGGIGGLGYRSSFRFQYAHERGSKIPAGAWSRASQISSVET